MFAEVIQYDGRDITVIFDDDDVEVQNGEGAVTIVSQAMFTAQLSDVVGIAEGIIVVARGVTYQVMFWKQESDTIDVFLENLS